MSYEKSIEILHIQKMINRVMKEIDTLKSNESVEKKFEIIVLIEDYLKFINDNYSLYGLYGLNEYEQKIVSEYKLLLEDYHDMLSSL